MAETQTQQNLDEDVDADNNDDISTLSTEADVINVASQKEDKFNFGNTTIILGIQIQPGNIDDSRQVLITAGIKGEPPVIQITTLQELAQCPVIAEILIKLKTILPQMAEQVQQREAKKQKLLDNKSENNKVVNPPDLPPTNPHKINPSNQLTLF